MDIGKLMQVDVESLNYSANAVGWADGFVVFINGGVPGDRLIARLTEVKRNYAIAEIAEIISSSPHRCDPPCPHFSEGCGGCQWQNVDYEHQLYWKEDIIRQALRRIGKLADIPKIEVRGERKPFRYRQKLRLFPVRKDDKTLLGLRRQDSHEVVPIRECLISAHEINSLKPLFSGEISLKADSFDEVSIRASVKDKRVMVSCKYRDSDPLIERDIEQFSHISGIASIFLNIGRNKRETLVYGNPFISEVVEGIEYRISPECFFQVNIAGLEELISLVKDCAGNGNRLILDAHCGVGTFALQVAGFSDVVWGIDISSQSIELAQVNAQDNGISNANFRKGTIADLLGSELRNKQVDMAILDPPRGGCAKGDMRALMELQPAKVLYISCNPTTLARDMNHLYNAGYKLIRLAMVDMFPMTYHMETIAFCVKDKGGNTV